MARSSIYTDSGVTLFQDTPRTVSFTPTPTLVDGANGGAVTVDGVPITGANSPMPIQSGALAGYAAVRDTLAPEYQAQLDQIAGGLINAFAESDQSATPTLPSLPGLFTTPGATSLPSMSATDGSRRRDRGQSECRPLAGRQSESAARRRHLRSRKSGLYLQHDRRGQLYGAHPGAHRPDQRDAELRSIRRPRLIGQPHRLRQRFGELAASAEPAGERRLLLSERGRDAGEPRRCRTRPASISTPR